MRKPNLHTALLINSEALFRKEAELNTPLLAALDQSDIYNVFILIPELNLADTLEASSVTNKDYQNPMVLEASIRQHLKASKHTVQLITSADYVHIPGGGTEAGDAYPGQAYRDLFYSGFMEQFDTLIKESLKISETSGKSSLEIMWDYFLSHLPSDITHCIYVDTHGSNLERFSTVANTVMPRKWATMLITQPPAAEMYEDGNIKRALKEFYKVTPSSGDELYNQFLIMTYRNELVIASNALNYEERKKWVQAIIEHLEKNTHLAVLVSTISEILRIMDDIVSATPSTIFSATPSTEDVFILTTFLEITGRFIIYPTDVKSAESYHRLCSFGRSSRGPAWNNLRTQMRLLERLIDQYAEALVAATATETKTVTKRTATATESTALIKDSADESVWQRMIQLFKKTPEKSGTPATKPGTATYGTMEETRPTSGPFDPINPHPSAAGVTRVRGAGNTLSGGAGLFEARRSSAVKRSRSSSRAPHQNSTYTRF